MLNEEKIKLMTAMAVYEEKYGKQDRIADSYYMGDYIFKKNSWTRILIFAAFVILALMYVGFNLINENVDFFSSDFTGMIVKILIVLVILMIIYTSIGTAINKKRYNDAEMRLEKLEYLKKLLERIELEEIMEKFAASPKDEVALPAKRWLNGDLDSETLKKALTRAYKDCGDCGCELDMLYDKAFDLVDKYDLVD